MADMYIQVPTDSTGKKVDTSELTVGANTVERQRIVLADDSAAAALGKVQNADPGSTDYGLTVRDVRGNAALPVRVDPTGTTVQPVSGTVTANAGTGTFVVNGISLTVAAGQATASGDTTIIAAPGAGHHVLLYRLILSNSHATTALVVGYKFGAGSVVGKAYLPAAGGAVVHNVIPAYHDGGDNNALIVNLSALGQIEWTAYYTTT